MPGPIEPITKRGWSGVEQSAATSLGDARRLLVDLERLFRDLVLVEHEREGAERRSLHRVDPGREELGVHLGHEVGPGEHEHLVAALEGRPAEVVGAEVVALHPRAERTVEDEDTFPERVEEGVTARRC